MTRMFAAALIAGPVFIAMLAAAAVAVRFGLVSDDALRLWANAIVAGNGRMGIDRLVSAYPPIPFFLTAAFAVVPPIAPLAPALTAAGLAGGLAGRWFFAFRAAGLPFLIVVFATALLIFHPTLMEAAVADPAALCLAVFLYLFGTALYDLRRRTGVPEVMRTGFALFGLAFSHPMGAAVAISSVPFLAFAVQPQRLASDALNVVLALVFPTLFATGAFLYVGWAFSVSGWSLFATPVESQADWLAGMRSLNLQSLPMLAGVTAMAIALCLSAPLVPVTVSWITGRRPLTAPALVYLASVLTAAALAAGSGFFGDPAPLALAAPVLAAVLLARVQALRDHLLIALPLILIGWIGGMVAIVVVDPRHIDQAVSVLERQADRERRDALALGGATIGRNGVLVDTANAPAVIVGRGTAHGLFIRSDETFELATMLARLNAPFVAVPNPRTPLGMQDRLNHAFPQLFATGPPGYQLAYRNESWRLFARK